MTTLLHDPMAFPSSLQGGILCIGNFDGVHRGHQHMLFAARDLADSHSLPLTIMTFDPHPITLLRPDVTPAPLMTMEQRRQALGAFNPDVLLVIQTTREFLDITADAFLERIVRGAVGATHIVEGGNFTYGFKAQGTVETLQRDAGKYGYAPTIIPTLDQALTDLQLVTVSSSLIRWLVQQGRVRDAALCLGRPYTLRGAVVKGEQRGRTIGFPTANVALTQIRPGEGVYAGRVIVDGTQHAAAISVGTNPTFDGKQTTVEAFLLDFSADLYARTVDVEFHHWLRDQEKYSGVEPLIRQLNKDVAQTRALMQQQKNASGVQA